MNNIFAQIVHRRSVEQRLPLELFSIPFSTVRQHELFSLQKIFQNVS